MPKLIFAIKAIKNVPVIMHICGKLDHVIKDADYLKESPWLQEKRVSTLIKSVLAGEINFNIELFAL